MSVCSVGSIESAAVQKKFASQGASIFIFFGFGVEMPSYTYTAYTGMTTSFFSPPSPFKSSHL